MDGTLLSVNVSPIRREVYDGKSSPDGFPSAASTCKATTKP